MRFHSDPCDSWYFQDARNVRGAKTDDSCEDGGFEASKTTTVARMATPRGSIPVTVGTFGALGRGVGGYRRGGAGEPRTEIIYDLKVHAPPNIIPSTCVGHPPVTSKKRAISSASSAGHAFKFLVRSSGCPERLWKAVIARVSRRQRAVDRNFENAASGLGSRV